MFEHLLILSILGFFSISNVSLFMVPYVIIAMSRVKMSNVSIVILSVAFLLSGLFIIVAVYHGFDGRSSLKSNLVTILPIIFLSFSAYVKYEKLQSLLFIYILISFLYVCSYLYSVNFNIWKLRHADDFILLGWPTNTPLVFAVGYFIIDQSKLSKIRKLLLKCFCSVIIVLSLNRVSVLFIVIIVILDLMRNSYRNLSGFLITIILSLSALYNLEWISEQASIMFRFDDLSNSLSAKSSFGHRVLVSWKIAYNEIITYPFLGTGGVGMSHLEPSYKGLTTESVYLDTIMRYGIPFGVIILSFYLLILYQIWKMLRHNVLIYPIICMFLLSFSLSDIMRFPHIIILLTTLYGFAKWSKNADIYS